MSETSVAKVSSRAGFVGARIPDDTYHQIVKLAQAQGITTRAWLRLAIGDRIEKDTGTQQQCVCGPRNDDPGDPQPDCPQHGHLTRPEAPQPRVLWEGTPSLLEVSLRILHGDGSQQDVHTVVESGSRVRVVIEDAETTEAETP